MRKPPFISFASALSAILYLLLASCHSGPPKTDVTKNVKNLDGRIQKDIASLIVFSGGHGGMMPAAGKDSLHISRSDAVQLFYKGRNYQAAWSDTGQLFPQADSMLNTISNSYDDGLKPGWYHIGTIKNLLQAFKTDPAARWDAVKWSTADILLTDAFMHLADNLHYGVLPPDSISLERRNRYTDSSLVKILANVLRHHDLGGALDSLKPQASQYQELSRALRQYRQKYSHRRWDTLPLKYSDTLLFQRLLAERLLAGGELDSSGLHSPGKIKDAVKEFQQRHALYPDGVTGPRTIAALNLSKNYRLEQIAVNLERWRHVGDSLPPAYLWVNIPSFRLKLLDHDSVILQSKVIVGKPGHETPLLNSKVTNFQLYPYWRVPISIIAREMLPAIRRDTGYLRKHNLEVVDRHNNIVDPSGLNWKKYNKHYFPYVIRQMTGLDNSLGIIKFNFRNKYSVYLHDTNLRNLFNLTHRDLSHGCVRVQQWEPLAMYLIRDDTLRHMPDSVNVWMEEKQQKWVALRKRLPIYIRYFTCEADPGGKITFYEDIYGYDKTMIRKMFH